MTSGEVDQLLAVIAKGLAPVLKATIQKATEPLAKRIEALERQPVETAKGLDSVHMAQFELRLRAVEDRPAAVAYAGVWQAREYLRDQACTHQGSLWIARRDTKTIEKPGDDSLAWQLAVKKGRDGRDGKDTSGA